MGWGEKDLPMTRDQAERLADIRAKLLLFSCETDVSTWEATFFLKLLSEKEKEIKHLRSQLR